MFSLQRLKQLDDILFLDDVNRASGAGADVDVFLPPAASLPVCRRLLHLPGQVQQLQVHYQRQVRKPLPRLLPPRHRLAKVTWGRQMTLSGCGWTVGGLVKAFIMWENIYFVTGRMAC